MRPPHRQSVHSRRSVPRSKRRRRRSGLGSARRRSAGLMRWREWRVTPARTEREASSFFSPDALASQRPRPNMNLSSSIHSLASPQMLTWNLQSCRVLSAGLDDSEQLRSLGIHAKPVCASGSGTRLLQHNLCGRGRISSVNGCQFARERRIVRSPLLSQAGKRITRVEWAQHRCVTNDHAGKFHEPRIQGPRL